MPPVIGLLTSVGGALSGAAALTIAGIPIGGIVLQLGASLVLGGIVNLLRGDQGSVEMRGRTISVRIPAGPREIVYGTRRKGGVVVFLHSTQNNEYLNIVVVISSNRSQSIGTVYFDGIPAIDANGNSLGKWVGKISNVEKALGSQTTNPFPLLSAETDNLWTSSHKLRECTAISMRLKQDRDAFPNGVPDISFDVQGKNDVLDPRTNTTGFTENPALCIADYMSLQNFGLGIQIGSVDGISSSSIIESANICDENVARISGGTEKRYTLNGEISLSNSPESIIQAMLTSMAGEVVYRSTKWYILAGAYRPPSVSFNPGDLDSNSLTIRTRVPVRENFNGVRGKFISPENDWQVDDFPAYKSSTYTAEDNNVDSWADIELPFTISSSMAQRLAKIHLEKNRRQMSVYFSGKLPLLKATAGDNVSFNFPYYGINEKPFNVSSVSFSGDSSEGARLEIILRETSPLVFSWEATEEQIYNAAPRTNLPSAFISLPPANLQAFSSSVIALDGTFVNNIVVRWQPPAESFITHYEVEWRKTSVTEFNGSVTSSLDFFIPSVEYDVTYAIRVRAVNALGSRGPFSDITFSPGPDLTAPGLPTSFAAQGDFSYILLTWVNPSDRDLNYCEVWESENNSFNSALQIAESYGDSFTRGNLGPLITRFYWIRSVDASGNKSNFVGPVSSTTRVLGDGEISSAAIWNQAFDRHDAALGSAEGTIQVLHQQFTALRDQVDDLTEASITDFSTIQVRVTSITAEFSNSIASFQQELTLFADEFNAFAAEVTTLSATVGENTASINTLAATRVTAEGAVAAVDQVISAEYGGMLALAQATAFAEATLDGISSGFVFSLSGTDVLSMVSVGDGLTPPVITARIAGQFIRLDGNVQVTGDFMVSGGTPGAARVEINSLGVRVFDSSNVMRVKIGAL